MIALRKPLIIYMFDQRPDKAAKSTCSTIKGGHGEEHNYQEDNWRSEGPNEYRPGQGGKQQLPGGPRGGDREVDEARGAAGGGEAHKGDTEPDQLL